MTGRGLLVLSEEIYKRLHLTAPKEGDETIGGLTDEETTRARAVRAGERWRWGNDKMSPMTLARLGDS